MAAGIVVGVYAMTRLRRRVMALTPVGLQGSVERLATAVRYFGDEVRAGMDERERELRDALGIDQEDAR